MASVELEPLFGFALFSAPEKKCGDEPITTRLSHEALATTYCVTQCLCSLSSASYTDDDDDARP